MVPGVPDGLVDGPDPDAPPYGQVVAFMLVQLGFEVARRFGTLMGGLGLEPRHFAVLRTLGLAEGRAQSEVADLVHIPPSSLVALIDHFEGRGLVERRPHPRDRRAHALHLTDEGRTVLARATELAMGLEGTLCEGFDPEQRQELLAVLRQLVANLGLPAWHQPGDPPPD